ncbi:basic proline-rich protein-like [Falco peregrinus]|uniref:basic proline-rich protein-like n=1 Tax=Falco peregrinus TaxID=8954 RepID=UPI00247A8633|nr:basic proline-rich protein-like [Falco peregrinus]
MPSVLWHPLGTAQTAGTPTCGKTLGGAPVPRIAPALGLQTCAPGHVAARTPFSQPGATPRRRPPHPPAGVGSVRGVPVCPPPPAFIHTAAGWRCRRRERPGPRPGEPPAGGAGRCGRRKRPLAGANGGAGLLPGGTGRSRRQARPGPPRQRGLGARARAAAAGPDPQSRPALTPVAAAARPRGAAPLAPPAGGPPRYPPAGRRNGAPAALAPRPALPPSPPPPYSRGPSTGSVRRSPRGCLQRGGSAPRPGAACLTGVPPPAPPPARPARGAAPLLPGAAATAARGPGGFRGRFLPARRPPRCRGRRSRPALSHDVIPPRAPRRPRRQGAPGPPPPAARAAARPRRLSAHSSRAAALPYSYEERRSGGAGAETSPLRAPLWWGPFDLNWRKREGEQRLPWGRRCRPSCRGFIPRAPPPGPPACNYDAVTRREALRCPALRREAGETSCSAMAEMNRRKETH